MSDRRVNTRIINKIPVSKILVFDCFHYQPQ